MPDEPVDREAERDAHSDEVEFAAAFEPFVGCVHPPSRVRVASWVMGAWCGNCGWPIVAVAEYLLVDKASANHADWETALSRWREARVGA